MEEKKRKKQGGKKQRKIKGCLAGGCQGSIWQRYCMDGGRRSMSRNIGRDWKKIGSDGKGTHLQK